MGAFTRASAEKKPRHYIIGRLREVEDRGIKDPAKGNYTIGLKFAPVLSTRNREERFYLTFKPEWLSASFDPDQLDRGAKFLHTNNMAGTNGVPPAEAIMGSEAFGGFVSTLEGAGSLEAADFVAALEGAVGRLVGLILVQDAEMVEQPDGKKKRVLQDTLSVGSFFLQGGVADVNRYVGKQLQLFEADPEYKVTARAAWEVDPYDPENSADPFELAAEESGGGAEMHSIDEAMAVA